MAAMRPVVALLSCLFSLLLTAVKAELPQLASPFSSFKSIDMLTSATEVNNSNAVTLVPNAGLAGAPSPCETPSRSTRIAAYICILTADLSAGLSEAFDRASQAYICILPSRSPLCRRRGRLIMHNRIFAGNLPCVEEDACRLPSEHPCVVHELLQVMCSRWSPCASSLCLCAHVMMHGHQQAGSIHLKIGACLHWLQISAHL